MHTSLNEMKLLNIMLRDAYELGQQVAAWCSISGLLQRIVWMLVESSQFQQLGV